MNITLLRQFNDKYTWIAIDEDSGAICLRRVIDGSEAQLYLKLNECEFSFTQKILAINLLENGSYELIEEYLQEPCTKLRFKERRYLAYVLSEAAKQGLKYNVRDGQLYYRDGLITLDNRFFMLSEEDNATSKYRCLIPLILGFIIIIASIIALITLRPDQDTTEPTTNVETTTEKITESTTNVTTATTSETETTYKVYKTALNRWAYCETLGDGRFVFYGDGEGLIDNSYLLPGMEPWRDANELVLEDGISQIGGTGFFAECTHFTIQLPDTLNIIGVAAFKECSDFEIVIPRSVEVINEAAFYGCRDAKILIPKETFLLGVHIFDEEENVEIIYY